MSDNKTGLNPAAVLSMVGKGYYSETHCWREECDQHSAGHDFNCAG